MRRCSVFVFCLLFASCSGWRIEKRHYRSGFFLERNKHIPTASDTADSAPSVTQQLPVKQNDSGTTASSPEQTHVAGRDTTKHLFHRRKKTGFTAQTQELEQKQRDEINHKAKKAGTFAGIGRLLAIAAFIVMLCQLLTVFLILAALAVIFFLLAILFGFLAIREIGDSGQPGVHRAQQAIGIALGTMGLFAILYLLAQLVRMLA